MSEWSRECLRPCTNISERGAVSYGRLRAGEDVAEVENLHSLGGERDRDLPLALEASACVDDADAEEPSSFVVPNVVEVDSGDSDAHGKALRANAVAIRPRPCS